jgi:hypothetical protein
LKSGREKVIRERKKNVHAFVIGEYQGAFVGPEENKAYYNPYKTSTFIDQDLCMLSNASSVTCVNKQIKFNY